MLNGHFHALIRWSKPITILNAIGVVSEWSKVLDSSSMATYGVIHISLDNIPA